MQNKMNLDMPEQGKELPYNDFSGMDLRGINFNGKDMSRTRFVEAKMKGVQLVLGVFGKLLAHGRYGCQVMWKKTWKSR